MQIRVIQIDAFNEVDNILCVLLIFLPGLELPREACKIKNQSTL